MPDGASVNKLIVLLLVGLAWVNSARAADTLEYEFTGRVTELTCKVELYRGQNYIVLLV